MTVGDNEDTILAMERGVLDRWSKGDPHGFVENAADDVTWFDHTTKSRVDGRVAVAEHVQQFVGQIDVARYEMPNVQVRAFEDTAVLTCNWLTFSEDGELTSQWNATEVYRRAGDRWQYVHVHWAPVM